MKFSCNARVRVVWREDQGRGAMEDSVLETDEMLLSVELKFCEIQDSTVCMTLWYHIKHAPIVFNVKLL